MSSTVDDRYFYATIDKMENGKFMKDLLTSNELACGAIVGVDDGLLVGLLTEAIVASVAGLFVICCCFGADMMAFAGFVVCFVLEMNLLILYCDDVMYT